MSTFGSSPGTTTLVLKRREPLLDDLAAERGDVVVRAELRRSRHLPRSRPRRPAVRPVHRDGVPRRAAEELVDGHAERLRLEVEQRVLDASERLCDHRAGALARGAIEIPVDRLDGPRIAADDERREVFDDSREPARRAVRVRDLGPADGPVVSRRLEEDPGPPPGVAEERLETGDLHEGGAYGGAPDRRQRRSAARDETFGTLPVVLVVHVEALVSLGEERRDDAAFTRPCLRHDSRPGDLERAVLDVHGRKGLVLARVPGDLEL